MDYLSLLLEYYIFTILFSCICKRVSFVVAEYAKSFCKSWDAEF